MSFCYIWWRKNDQVHWVIWYDIKNDRRIVFCFLHTRNDFSLDVQLWIKDASGLIWLLIIWIKILDEISKHNGSIDMPIALISSHTYGRLLTISMKRKKKWNKNFFRKMQSWLKEDTMPSIYLYLYTSEVIIKYCNCTSWTLKHTHRSIKLQPQIRRFHRSFDAFACRLTLCGFEILRTVF